MSNVKDGRIDSYNEIETFPRDQLDAFSAEGIIASDPEYYRIFGLSDEAITGIILKLIKDPRSDLYQPRIDHDLSALRGLCITYPASEMKGRQITSLKAFMTEVQDGLALRKTVKDFASHLSPAATDSHYLGKMFVSEDFRGLRVGSRLMSDYEQQARKSNSSRMSLHVRRNNASAVRLYQHSGFEPKDDHLGLAYIYMERAL